ncbi:hypothetical protein [Amycolatopsis sp. NPDC004625]|uniref:hypothetical protein n=1 Tax=Amycolatopsis sp. NPDC004625 TaxID=3154670 RepID=UPI00339E38FD
MPENGRFDSPADRRVGELLGRAAADAALAAEPVGVDRIRVLAARRRGRRAIAAVVAAVVVSAGAIMVVAASGRDERVQPAGPPSPSAGTTTVSIPSPVSTTITPGSRR